MKFERLNVDKLIKDGLIKFFIRYVDDNLVLAKVEDIDNIMEQFNSFDKSFQFTTDRFEDGIVHFLDIKMVLRQTCIIKPLILDCVVIFPVLHSRIKALDDCATKICSSSNIFNSQINRIKIRHLYRGTATLNMLGTVLIQKYDEIRDGDSRW